MHDALPPHLGLLLQVIDEPMFLVQSDGVVVAANFAMGRQLHIPWQTLTGAHLSDLLATPWETARLYLQRACGSRQSTPGTLLFRRADGSEITYQCHGNLVQPAHAGDAAILGLRCRARSDTLAPFLRLNQRLDELKEEIVRRQQAEQRLQQLNRDLEARVEQEVAARAYAQDRLAQAQRMEALGQLSAGIAHDFNNVLQAVSGGLALIQKRADNRDLVMRFARMAMEAADRGATITGRLLAFARRGELRAEVVDADTLLAALQEMLDPVVGSTIAVCIAVEADTPMFDADRGQLETALINLVVNARDAMPDGGTVTIAAAPETIGASGEARARLRPGRYVRLTVTDTGVGMDAATLARAAEPFFTTKPIGQGTGLGLAMACGFAQQSGGDYAIESTQGCGTTVSLWLPQSQSAVRDFAADSHTAANPVVAKAARVLLVDDDALVREVLACGLADRGYQVTEASDGLAALAWLERGDSLDVLVTDFSMPGMNGLALINEVRRTRASLPTLLLTGYADAAVLSAMEAVESQTTALLRKPIRSDELAEQVAVLLAGRGAATVAGLGSGVAEASPVAP